MNNSDDIQQYYVHGAVPMLGTPVPVPRGYPVAGFPPYLNGVIPSVAVMVRTPSHLHNGTTRGEGRNGGPADMESLRAQIAAARPGTGEVAKAIASATFAPRAQAFTSLIQLVRLRCCGVPQVGRYGSDCHGTQPPPPAAPPPRSAPRARRSTRRWRFSRPCSMWRASSQTPSATAR